MLMLESYRWLVIRDWRERYPTLASGLGEVLALGLSLTLYYFTARAFGVKLELDYFRFVTLGEGVLLVPLCVVTGFLRVTREASADGTLEALLALPIGGRRALLMLGLATVPREVFRAVLWLAIATLAFGLRVDLGGLVAAAGVLALSLPAFISVGACAAAVFLKWGRGEGAVGTVTVLASLLAGAYFPTQVLPASIQELGRWISPFSAALEASRLAFDGVSFALWLEPLAALAAWAAVSVPLGAWSLGHGVRAVRERGAIVWVR